MSISAWPFVSVVVPAFNAADTIEGLVQSLLALDYPADCCEIIIVDNGSTDNTRQIIGQYPVKLLEEKERRGPAAARNKGIQHARGDIIAFTDADCLADRQWLTMLLAKHSDPTIGGFVGELKGREPAETKVEKIFNRYRSNSPIRAETSKDGATQFTLTRRAPVEIGRRECLWLRWGVVSYYKRRPPIPLLSWGPTPNVAYRKDVFEKVGLFDINLPRGEDVDLAWRMQLLTEYRFQPAPEAFISHRHPATLAEALKYRYKGGLGKLYIIDKYMGLDRGIRGEVILESSLNMILDSSLAMGVLGYRCLTVLARRQAYPFSVEEAVLNLLGSIAFNLGRIRACLAWPERKTYAPQ